MRSHLSSDIDENRINQTVTICGWVQSHRDHGGVLFIDLRDPKGILQLVASPEDKEIFAVATRLRSEFVIQATGVVRPRPPGTENKKLPSGAIEIALTALTILNPAVALPFLPDDLVGEDTRLRHRVINLRGPLMQRNLRLRHTLTAALRDWLNHRDFIEIETPLLTRATPEGARDFLVPSRLQRGEYYALPQSPQLFKQMLVTAGFERYYQIVRCFRDEDLRADRQPEFTQLDIEMAFIDETIIIDTMEEMIHTLFQTVAGVTLPSPFPRLTWRAAMDRYGTDKPDLRNPLHLTDLTDLMRAETFQVFRAAADHPNGRVAALRLPGGGDRITRKDLDTLTALVARHGAKGLATIKCQNIADRVLQSPITKHLSQQTIDALLARTQAQDGDLIFFGAGDFDTVSASLAALRDHLTATIGDLLTDDWRPLWIIDFPLFERQDGQLRARHHPFTAPQLEDGVPLTPSENLLSRAYDLVLNGVEIGGGSIRIHQPARQKEALTALGIPEAQAHQQFGFLLTALSSGAPPHGGIAFGLDRLTALLAGATSIREVIAFPKTQRGQCLLTAAPAPVAPETLHDLGLRPLPPVVP